MVDANRSLIFALHARYEKAWDEYNTADRASTAARGAKDVASDRLRDRCERGMQENIRESETLQLAICHQVPTTDAELTVLAHHAWLLFADEAQMVERDREALEQALTSMFDYLVSEGRVELDAIGHQFRNNAMLANRRRCARTGLVDELAA
jgi:hypothetical protein